MGARTTDYDSIAADYDRRYGIHEYAGVRDYLFHFVGTGAPAAAILEVGCGTGHWLSALEARLKPSALDAARLKPSAYEEARLKASPYEEARLKASPYEEARLKPSPYEEARLKPSALDAARTDPEALERSPYDRSAKASAERPIIAGLEPSAGMIARA